VHVTQPKRLSKTIGERARCPSAKGERVMKNPKTKPTDNAEKDPQDWVSGDEPMTGAQASYLKTLCEQAHLPDEFDEGLTKAEASEKIEEART